MWLYASSVQLILTHCSASPPLMPLLLLAGWLGRPPPVPPRVTARSPPPHPPPVCLEKALPSPKRAGVAQTFDYMQWLVTERTLGVRSQQAALQVRRDCGSRCVTMQPLIMM